MRALTKKLFHSGNSNNGMPLLSSQNEVRPNQDKPTCMIERLRGVPCNLCFPKKPTKGVLFATKVYSQKQRHVVKNL